MTILSISSAVQVASISTLFVVGSFWFWVGLIAAAIIITALIEGHENGGSLSSLVCVVTLVLFWFLGAGHDLNGLVNFIIQAPAASIGIFLLYILAGAFWSVGKWYFFVVRLRDEYIERIDNYGNGKVSQSDVDKHRPKPSTYKGRITSWMFYWPFSITWTLLNEPVRKIYLTLFNWFEESFEKISDKVFSSEKLKSRISKKDD